MKEFIREKRKKVSNLLEQFMKKHLLKVGAWTVVITEAHILATKTRGYKAFGGEFLLLPLFYLIRYLLKGLKNHINDYYTPKERVNQVNESVRRSF